MPMQITCEIFLTLSNELNNKIEYKKDFNAT